mmetsp:Transcript_17715/g.32022  ORF Transcript_17715/g.32022 Transcript_17715/m.32022 type:complete len:689 (-) Transcript_17715:75-2141(-)|eukprot:CAMPEP_0198299196 /NCGR_PEP_ID=MMETSP1449-20131203/43823_1 /TAXON_ID=420275 /ORGANISM="Attheya septentrionalis, Strain CCMP2084" /LENGTH=688 /DNA_ID=CAMNT_0044000675 /DNA_START=242 /DNA_END=2308 /DNA_ORIENTATION=-
MTSLKEKITSGNDREMREEDSDYSSSSSFSDDGSSISGRNDAKRSSTRKSRHLSSSFDIEDDDASKSTMVSKRWEARGRVPGGAAAKQMLIAMPRPPDEDPDIKPNVFISEVLGGVLSQEGFEPILTEEKEEPAIVNARTEELDEDRKKVVHEWEKGTSENSRYIETKDSNKDVNEEGDIPNSIDRKKVFHEDAAAAIRALLKPQYALKPQAQEDKSPINTKDYPWEVPNITVKPLLTATAEVLLGSMRERMVDPSKRIADLISNIRSPDDGAPMDRGYMVRRMNACGALKVLTSTIENRQNICWTVGVLIALTSVLSDTGKSWNETSILNAYREARNRAVNVLLNLVAEKENRILMFHSPGLVQSLQLVLNEDDGESRQGCCSILTYFSKTTENRLLMVQVPGLVSTMISIIKSDTGGSSVQPSLGSNADIADSLAPSSGTNEYDNDSNSFLHGARLNVFATVLHVAKEKDNQFHLARHEGFVSCLIDIANIHASPSHERAITILAHLTRHESNSKYIVTQCKQFTPTMVYAMLSPNGNTRKFAALAIQNISVDEACRKDVANTKFLLEGLCRLARHSGYVEEQLAALRSLNNLADDPENLIPMSNTPECFATLIRISKGNQDGATEIMQYVASNALATISHWLRQLATYGSPSELKGKERNERDTLDERHWAQWTSTNLPNTTNPV